MDEHAIFRKVLQGTVFKFLSLSYWFLKVDREQNVQLVVVHDLPSCSLAHTYSKYWVLYQVAPDNCFCCVIFVLKHMPYLILRSSKHQGSVTTKAWLYRHLLELFEWIIFLLLRLIGFKTETKSTTVCKSVISQILILHWTWCRKSMIFIAYLLTKMLACKTWIIFGRAM